MISSATDTTQMHNDLLTYIFTTLTTSTIAPFKEEVQKWYVSYLEAQDATLTPEDLILWAENKMHVLQHAGLWHTTELPAFMALKLDLAQQKEGHEQLVKSLVAHLTRFNNRARHQGNDNNTYQYPNWMITAPISLSKQTKLMNGKIYVWCTKCRQGMGL